MSESATFSAGVTEASITVNTTDDDIVEGGESFVIFLLKPSEGLSVGSVHTATVTIVDNGKSRNCNYRELQVF